MTDTLGFVDESRDRSILRKVEYDDADPKDLVLTVPKRDGGKIAIPLLENARSNIEREDYQENTLLRVKPLAEIASNLPVKSGGLTINQGKGVALLRPGYLYIFRKDRLWRELEISPDSQFSDVDLQAVRQKAGKPDAECRRVRQSVGQWLDDVLMPVFLQGQAVMHDFRMAYSEIQWDWYYVEKLEKNEALRNARTTAVGHAWAVTTVDSLNFQSGFPASRVEDVPELRHRDLGVELMIENPADFVPSFERPAENELYSKLSTLFQTNERSAKEGSSKESTHPDVADPMTYAEQMMGSPLDMAVKATAPNEGEESDEGGEASSFGLSCPAGADLLHHLRKQKGIACVALPDPLFKMRHCLAQIHLALHYFDAIDVSIQDKPLVHSATLIHQTLFHPQVRASDGHIKKLRSAVDQKKLHRILEQSEREATFKKITEHLECLESLIIGGDFGVACGDYLNHGGLGPCEAFALETNLLDLVQQLPGVLRAQSFGQPPILVRVLNLVLKNNTLIDAIVESIESGSEDHSLIPQLRTLAMDKEWLAGDHLNEVGLSSVSALAQHLTQESGNTESNEALGNGSAVSVGTAGKVVGMVETALSGWSAAVLKTADRLRESGDLKAIKLERVFSAVSAVADVADPKLGGELQVMRRDAVDLTRFSIVGVHGKGVSFGLTDLDLQSEALTRRNDYLFADRVDQTGKKVASTSPARLADEIGETVAKAAAHTWVFVLPIDHSEALKFRAWKFDWANKAKAVADGPGVSRVLVGLAAYNIISELLALKQSRSGEVGYSLAKFVSAGLDLSTALMKLHSLGAASEGRLVSSVILRPLFEMKSIPVIGPVIHKKLMKDGASTIVRTISLVNFFAVGVTVAVSSWDYRNSISRGDMDAALGHALAVVGGSIFAFSKLMAGLLLVPGWGIALFGLGLVLGGSLYAAISTDSEMEQVLKRGPFGVGPSHPGLPASDASYYSQLLSIFSPLNIVAKRFSDLDEFEKLQFSGHAPSPSDYRVTISSPLISRFELGQKSKGKASAAQQSKKPRLRIGVQELEYTKTTVQTSKTSAWNVDQYSLTKNTPLQRIKSWIPAPENSAVHFLVEKSLIGGEIRGHGYSEKRTIYLRVVLQALVESELGVIRYPMPVLDEYEAYDRTRHDVLPNKEKHVFNPFKNDTVPYWFVKEVRV
ncbi:MAG: hypothetical protein GYB26_06995 [Gammaproteobacteria bacterium]|nr:hypothetical protein [Gammaproteobacteria bacterium]